MFGELQQIVWLQLRHRFCARGGDDRSGAFNGQQIMSTLYSAMQTAWQYRHARLSPLSAPSFQVRNPEVWTTRFVWL